jgi:hypothetical protein
MTAINYKGIITFIVIIVALIFLLSVIVPGVDASPETDYINRSINNSYALVTVQTTNTPVPVTGSSGNISATTTQTSSVVDASSKTPAYNNTRIAQGQCIEIGGVYDISGVIGYTLHSERNSFAYYGRYEDAFDPSDNESISYRYMMPNERSAYYSFYIDPAIFKSRQGYWYQYDVIYERSANKRAFYVSDKCINNANATTLVNPANNIPVLINPIVMDTRHVADILLADDDPLYLDVTEEPIRVWVFGKTGTLFVNDTIANATTPLIPKSITKTWSNGEYNLLVQKRGNNSMFDAAYTKNTRTSFTKYMLTPALRSMPEVDVTGFSPYMVRERLVQILNQTDDEYTLYKMVIQEPTVEITGYQEIPIGNYSVMEVTGYTNKIHGTPITLYVDINLNMMKSFSYPYMTIFSENASIGDYRPFHGFIPLYYDQLGGGEHNLTAALQSGKYSDVEFHVMFDTKPHNVPSEYYKFIDGRPFIPTPTPVVIEKVVTQQVIKTEIRTVIEKEAVNYETLAIKVILTLILPAVVVLLFVGVPLTYIMSVVIRTYAERRMRKKNKIEEL